MDTATIESPCVDICELNADEVCIGCGRSLDEIGDWLHADTDRKTAIIESASKRRAYLLHKEKRHA